MPAHPLSSSQIVVQVCLFIFAAIALLGGSLQFYLGQPDTTPRLDNVHRFMAGVYLSMGFIKAHMNVGFFNGAALNDPRRLARGDRQAHASGEAEADRRRRRFSAERSDRCAAGVPIS